MKSKTTLGLLALVLLSTISPQLLTCSASTTIDAVNKYAYGANLGWMGWRDDVANEVVIGEYVCSGYIYAANVGWINLGSGTPTNGVYYQNLSTNDFGVNQDGLGNLRGYAWGANIGWVNFEATGAPAVDLNTGKFSGYVWSANCGWISLSNAVAFVQTDTLQQGALASNGLPVAWLLANFGTTNVNANADPDHDGLSNLQEYLAGTNPNDINSNLRITTFMRADTYNTLMWSNQPARFYRVERKEALSTGSPWEELSFGFEGLPGWNNVGFDSTGPQYFYRVRAVRPLMP